MVHGWLVECQGVCTCSCAPPPTLAKSLVSGSLTTSKFQRNPSNRSRDTEKGAHLHVRTCGYTPPMNCVICIVAWSLNTHQILSPSAHPFLSYSLAATFDTHPLCKCRVPHWLPRWMDAGSIHRRRNVATHERKPFVKQTCGY